MAQCVGHARIAVEGPVAAADAGAVVGAAFGPRCARAALVGIIAARGARASGARPVVRALCPTHRCSEGELEDEEPEGSFRTRHLYLLGRGYRFSRSELLRCAKFQTDYVVCRLIDTRAPVLVLTSG